MIQTNNEDWLNDLKEMVGGISDKAPEGAFEAIMATAAGARRRARARRTVALVAGLAAAAAVSTLFLLPEGAVDAPQNEGCLMAESAAAEAVEDAGAVEAFAPETSEPAMQIVPAVPVQLVAATSAATSEPAAEAHTAATQPAVSAAAAPSSAQPSAVASEPETRPDLQNAPQNAPQTVTADNAAALNRYIASLDDEKPRRKRLHFSLHANSFMASNNDEITPMKIIIPSYSNSSSDKFGTTSSGGIQILPTGRQFYAIDYDNGMPVITQVADKYGLPLVIEAGKVEEQTVPVGRSFHAPVSAGITLSYDLTPGFAIESGISITLLSLLLSLDNCPTFCIDSYYAGIPLSFKADIYETNNSDFYLRAGGMAEKCIASTESGGFKPDKLFWSVSGYAGYQYRMNEFSSVYIEPGVSYHFDNGNMGYTIYENKPCLFSLQAGLRFIL